MYLSSLRPRLSGKFTSSVLIVFSFSSRPPVTTVFSHTVWAKPRCDTDFPNSVCVTVPASPVPLQKQTWFSFPTPLMGPLFSSRRSTGSGLYKFLFWEYFLFLVISCNGNVEMLSSASQTTYSVCDGCHVSSQGFSLWQSLSISVHITTAQCAVTWCGCFSTQNWFIHRSVMDFLVLFCLGPCSFSALTSGSNAKWDVIPKHNEVPVTACQPATCLHWHLLWVFPSGTESHCVKRLICPCVGRQH